MKSEKTIKQFMIPDIDLALASVKKALANPSFFNLTISRKSNQQIQVQIETKESTSEKSTYVSNTPIRVPAALYDLYW